MDSNDDNASNDSTHGSLTDLQQSFNQQQAKISALKELVRQSEEDHGKNTASAQEKVRNIAQRLTHLKSKTSRSRQSIDKSIDELHEEMSFNAGESSFQNVSFNRSGSQASLSSGISLPNVSRTRPETPGSEKIQLLRQQMEQNRLKMAERETNKRGIEQLVTQLKAKVDSSQHSLDRAHLLGSSVGDLSSLSNTPQKYQSTGDLGGGGFNLDRERVKYLEKRIKHLENEAKQKEHQFFHKDPESEQAKIIHEMNVRIIDLEESLKEKDGLIQAKTKAANLITESMSMKDKDAVELLAETKHEMAKMQESFLATEDEYSKRIGTLEKELQTKDKKIANLEEVNDILETARFDLTIKNSELDSKTGYVEDYVNKLSELNKINETLQRRIECLENEKEETGPSSTESELTSKMLELETTISQLQNENDDLKKSLQSAVNTSTTHLDEEDIIRNLEATITAQKEECARLSEILQNVQDQLTEKTVEYNVLMANFNVLDEKIKSYGPKSLFSRSSDEEAQAEISKLAKQLDDANKTGIKTKLKLKQLQKQVDAFKKESDKNKELAKLMDENQRQSDKIKELEAEVVHHTGSASALDESGADANTSSPDLQSKIKLLETTCQNQTSAIQLLEEQKLDMTTDLNSTKTELTSLKTQIKDHDKNEVTTQMDSIANEEQIEQCQKEINSLKQEIAKLNAEKSDLKIKLDRFVVENVELLEKIDKLSKGSSVESIEILERLTQDEKLEMERFQQADQHYHSGNDESGTAGIDEQKVSHSDSSGSEYKKSDLDETQSTAKSNDLIEKIQNLQDENNELMNTIEVLRNEKIQIQQNLEILETNTSDALNELKEKEGERLQLLNNISEMNANNSKLEDEIAALKKKNETKSDDSTLHFINAESYLVGMKSLNSELENYRNAKEKNAKVNASKKLARESKNLAELMNSLLVSYNSCAEEFKCYKAEIAGERESRQKCEEQQFQEMTSAHADESEIAQLKEQICQLDDITSESKQKCVDLERQLDLKELELTKLEQSSTDLKTENGRLNESIRQLEAELETSKEGRIEELKKHRKDFDNLTKTSNSEIEILRQLIEEQKQELITAYTEHEANLESVDAKIANYNKQIEQLQEELKSTKSQNALANNSQADELEQQIQTFETKLTQNRHVIDQQNEELANKQSTIETLNQQIMDLYKSMEGHTLDIADKDDDIERLQDALDRNKAELQMLNNGNLTSKNRIMQLETEVQQKSGEWSTERSELENKIKEQHEKMKKFAANLRKRNAQCSELEEKCASLTKTLEERPIERVVIPEVHAPIMENVAIQQTSNDSELIKLKEENELLKQRHEHEIVSVRADIDAKTEEIHILKHQLHENEQRLDETLSESNRRQHEIVDMQAKLTELERYRDEFNVACENLKERNIKIEKCKVVIKQKNKEIERLQEIEHAMKDRAPEVSTNELKMDLDQLQTEKDKISLDYENYRTFIDTKLQNNDLVIESMESDNTQLKERISELVESIRQAENQRSRLEHQVELLNTQLNEKQAQIEGMEDAFSAKLQTLIHQDQQIEQKLKKLEGERENLLDTVKDYETQNDNLKLKNIALERRLDELETNKLAELEMDNKEQSERIEKLQAELDHKQEELQRMTTMKNAELSDLENDLSNHLKKVEYQRRTLQEDLEKSREENERLNEQIAQLQEAQAQLEQIRIELEQKMSSIKMQNDDMTQDHLEAQDLRMQIVQYQTEVENLRSQNVDVSNRYTNELNSLQLQLQETIELNSASESQAIRAKEELNQENDSLKTKICEDQAEIVNLRLLNDQMTNDHEAELSGLHAHKQQLENEVALLRQQINEMNALQITVGQNVTQDQMEVHQLRQQISHDQTEIESLRHQLQQLAANHEVESAALRQQIAEWDSLRMQVGQNQTDDQVFIQNENERLQSVLAEKEIEIQNYQRQNLQLQMSAGMSSNDPFASISLPSADNDEVSLLSGKVVELEGRLETILNENNELQIALSELQRLNSEKDAEIARLQNRTPTGADSLLSVNDPIISSQHTTQVLSLEPYNLESAVDSNAGVSDSNADQQIEDLQRNVSDLEKYVTDLEHKLKAANEEIAKNNVERMNAEFNIANRTQQYEEQLSQLQMDLNRQQSELESIKAHQAPPAPVQEAVLTTASFFQASAVPDSSVFDVFGAASEADYSGQTPVVEETLVAKKAYVCHPSEQVSQGWGDVDNWSESAWGNEAILEEQYQQTLLAGQADAPNRSISILQAEIDNLKEERERSANDSNALQTKYKKLIKKMREYKEKIDELEAKAQQQQQKPAESNDLDWAIQDELSNQVKSLELRVKELKTDLEKENQEKKRLLSRVDVLASANDRMVEMKDLQDVEIEVCKAKIRELNGKLEKLNEWGDGEAEHHAGPNDALTAKLAEAHNQNRLLEDRISRMQASVSETDEFEDEREQFLEQLRVLSAEKVLLEENVHIRTSEIDSLTEKLTAMESQNNDFRSTIELLSVESNNIKTLLDQLKDEHKQKISENNDLLEKLKELMDKNVLLAKQMDEMRLYNLGSQDIEQRIQDLNACIQYKDSEIEALNEKIEAEKRCFEEDFQRLKVELVSNDKIISELKEEIRRLQNEKEQLELAKTEVPSHDVDTDLPNKVVEMQQLIEQLQTEKIEMEKELQVLNDQVLQNLEMEDRAKNIVLELDMKNIEISELKNTVNQLNGNRPNISQEDASQWQQKLTHKDDEHQAAINSLNIQWQQVVDDKCTELAESWRQHLHGREAEFAAVENELRAKVIQYEEEQSKSNSPTSEIQQTSKSSELSSSDSQQQSYEQKSTDLEMEQSEIMKTMQKALEAQEIEIVSLKEQLAIRSAEYARIAASVDPYGMKRNSIVGNERMPDENTGEGNKLDLALYVLHQRDMRCEELTTEVVQLLEERDTLQLKLSNSIRQFEEFKHRRGTDGEASGGSPPKVSQGVSAEGMAADMTDAKDLPKPDNLNSKLSELHKVGHSRDKTLFEEREQRRRQMSFLQRDLSNMPPEAIVEARSQFAELFGSDYDQHSRHNQNSATAILNWLWGSINESDN